MSNETLDNPTFQRKIIKGVESMADEIKTLEGDISGIKKHINDLTMKQSQLTKGRLVGLLSSPNSGQRTPGKMSDDAAANFAAVIVAHCVRSGRIDALGSDEYARERLIGSAREILGIQQRTALTTSDIPLPSVYTGDFKELIANFGIVRKAMTPYPMAGGTNKPPRMGTRPAFGSIAMSAAFGEKSPTVAFASLESHKIGGIVRLPREIDDQSIVNMGHFLARYGAVEFARAEDTWGFLADGSGTYESVVGVCTFAVSNSKKLQLASTKTHPSDAVLADFRNLRTIPSTAALTNGKYYMHRTWEPYLRGFRTAADQDCFSYRNDGTALLDGFEIVWTEVMPVYTTSATASGFIAVFGDLSFWWMGERHSPRIDTSEHVYFANDQLATRFIEEIDFDYMSDSALAVMQCAAS